MPASVGYDDLPTDNAQAFVVLEQQYRKAFEVQIEGCEHSSTYYHFECEYMNKVLAAAKALEISYFEDFEVPGNSVTTSNQDAMRKFERDLQSYVEQVKILNGRRATYYGVRLDASEKAKIRHHIDQVKIAIESSPMAEAKKEAIFKKINALLNEIDRDRTRFDVFADFSGRLAEVSKNFAKEGAEPWWKWIKPIFEILGAAKESEEQRTGLPSPEEQKRIEPPRKQLPSPEPESFGSLDDDVPF